MEYSTSFFFKEGGIRLLANLKNKKGNFTIEYTITFLIIMMVIAFLVDATIVGYKRIKVASATQTIVEVIRSQGGIASSMPKGFSGNGTTYVTSGSLANTFNQTMNQIQVDNASFSVNGTTITGGSNISIPYKKSFEVSVTYTPRWTFIRSILPLLGNTSQRYVTYSTSEYKTDYGDWEGEKNL